MESRRCKRLYLQPPAVPELGDAVQQDDQRALASLHVMQSLVADLGVALAKLAGRVVLGCTHCHLRVGQAISGEPGDLLFLWVSSSRVVALPLAHLLAGRQQLAAGPLGERLHSDRVEQLVGRAQLLARVHTSVLAAEPLAVEELGAGELRSEPGTAQTDRSLRDRGRRPRRRG